MNEPLDDYDAPRSIVKPSPFPGLMLATAIFWIVAGGAYLGLFALSRLLQLPFQANELWLVVGAGFFIWDGVQLIRGEFRDPLGDGIITILLGLFFLGQGYYDFAHKGSASAVIVGGFFGFIFLVPGILALIGRKRYLAWKAERLQ